VEKIKIIHVDDQVSQLQLVKSILNEFDEINLVNQFDNAVKAKEFILANEVDLAILDIEMPDKDGFWLAEQIKDTRTLIVFLTSHPDYALKAFEACAIHYMLKPLTKEVVGEIITRYKKIAKISSAENQLQGEKINEFLSHYINKQSYPRRIFINNVHKTTVLNLSEVLYMISSGPYTIIKSQDGSKQTASKLLKVYADALQNHPDFVRIHRAHMVNKNFVKAILRNKHKIAALMMDGAELEVSPQKREEIYSLLEL